jgi:flagellar protein FliO/FliZ
MNDWHSIFRMLGALFAVVVLAWAVARLMQRRQAGGGAGRRLAVTEVLAIDPRRRLLLIRCDGREALLLTGGQDDRLLGWLPPAPESLP